jgi:hypothetical protein
MKKEQLEFIKAYQEFRRELLDNPTKFLQDIEGWMRDLDEAFDNLTLTWK